MGKVKITQEQVEAFKYLHDEKYTHDNIMNVHPCWTSTVCQPLKRLSKSDMAKILYGEGYEIESELKFGDKIVNSDGNAIITGVYIAEYVTCDYFGCHQLKGISGSFLGPQFRKATQEEIYWYETLGREKINDIRHGDVMIYKHDTPRVVTEEHDFIYAENDMKYDLVAGIYPAESFKPYPQKEGN